MRILLAIALVAVSVAGAVYGLASNAADTFALGALPLVLVGALLLVKRPVNRVGWTLLAGGSFATTGTTATALAVASARAGDVGLSTTLLAWYGEWYWIPFLYLSLVAAPLLFPSGRLQSRWSRRLGRSVAAVSVLLTVAAMVQRDLLTAELERPLDNPFGLLPIGDVDFSPVVGVVVAGVLLSALLSVGSLFVRVRRARGVERQQLKVVLYGVTVTVAAFLLGGVLALPQLAGLQPLVISFTPLAMLVAILRYRLYDIDRILSRTVAYLLVSAVLVAVYLTSVVALRALLVPATGESDLAVAGSTLVVAAAFGPVRRRMQASVDRRFNRRRYDAAQAVEAFGQRLRDEVDLDEVAVALRGTVSRTVQPASVSLWLSPETRS